MTATGDAPSSSADKRRPDELGPSTVGQTAAGENASADGTFLLRLYIAGETPKSLAAIRNLELICATHLAGRYSIEVIDLRLCPERAAADQVLAIPTVVRNLPAPLLTVIGDLSDTQKVLVGLAIKPILPV